jgi:hypothetical protein
MCCLDPPDVLANGLYDMPKLSKRKSITIEDTLVVNIEQQPDLAFFLYKISPFMERPNHRGLFRIVDPLREDEEIGTEEMALTRRKYAVWNMLQKVDKLKVMARAYGVDEVDLKQPNAIRKELEELLERNDKAQKQNPAIKGTREFEEEMQVTDSVLLRNFIQKAKDDKKLDCATNGDWKVGEKVYYKVTASELQNTKQALCNYLSAGNNQEKLQEFLRDLLNGEYFDGITDKKEWVWLAKVAGVPHDFQKLEVIKMSVKKFYCPTLVEG